jgi:hypothetical protein
MFTGDHSSEWRCDYCNVQFSGDMMGDIKWIREGITDEAMHFCNYDHVARYYACKALSI